MQKDRVAIVGIGETDFAKKLEPSEKSLALTAILAALDDAGIAPEEVDGLASYTLESTDEVEIAKNIGAGDVTWFGQVGYGGGAGPACVGQLALAIAAGQCRVGVAWRSRKRGSGGRIWANTRIQYSVPAAWTRPWGLLRPVDEIAMLVRRY
ncbi:MAG TPA: lipid-transfer protein, partial [Alphaproteobacteria bacterium]|nr:lipid-transfer protein [Alphaproteobacteria bacterium]